MLHPLINQCMLVEHGTTLTHTSVSVQAEEQDRSPPLAGKVPRQQTSTEQDVTDIGARPVQPGHPETPQGAEGKPQVRRPG